MSPESTDSNNLVKVMLDPNAKESSPSKVSLPSTARNRHRERKMNSKQSRVGVDGVENSAENKLDSDSLNAQVKPNSYISRISSKDSYNGAPTISQTRPSKPVAVGSLEDVTEEEYYRNNDNFKKEQINMYGTSAASFAVSPTPQTTFPNLVLIKARNSALVKKELSAIKSRLREGLSDIPKNGENPSPAESPSRATNPETRENRQSLSTQPLTIQPIITQSQESPHSLQASSPADEFSKVLQKNNFAIMKMLDKLPLSAIKGDTTLQIQSIFSPFLFLECLVAMTVRVISDTVHVATLFRDNRLTNKMIDTFMTSQASAYLTSTLNPALKIVLSSRDPFEIDPRYLGDDSSLSENITHLLEMVSEITTSIYQSANRIPRNLQYFFSVIRREVQAKFPDDANAPLTAISAFTILRFFNPALIKASLENMEDIERNSRKFVLITKIIQKLANFQLFDKEKHMICLNGFLDVNFSKMKGYLMEISQPCDPASSTFLVGSIDLLSCHGLADTLASSLGAIYSFKTDTTLVTELDGIIKQLRQYSSTPTETPNLALFSAKNSPQSFNFENKKSSNLKQAEKSSSWSLSNVGLASPEKYANAGSIQIVENENGIMGQAVSYERISNANLNSVPASPYHNSRRTTDGNPPDLPNNLSALPPPAAVISDIPLKSEAVVNSTNNDNYAEVKVIVEEYPKSSSIQEQKQSNDLVPVEQIGCWKRRRSLWANVLTAFVIVVILGVGIGISYWKLYM